METRARSSDPDSPHPGHGHPSDWIAKPYSTMFTGLGLFILIFGIAIFLGYRQFETTRHNALTIDVLKDIRAKKLPSRVIGHHADQLSISSIPEKMRGTGSRLFF
jgi:hypothetical protein